MEREKEAGKTSDSQNDDDNDDDESSNLKSQCPKLHKYSHSSPSFPISDIVCLRNTLLRHIQLLNPVQTRCEHLPWCDPITDVHNSVSLHPANKHT